MEATHRRRRRSERRWLVGEYRSEKWSSAVGIGEQVGEVERRRLVGEQIGEVAAGLSWSRSERWPASGSDGNLQRSPWVTSRTGRAGGNGIATKEA
jgi:hypothetical protein